MLTNLIQISVSKKSDAYDELDTVLREAGCSTALQTHLVPSMSGRGEWRRRRITGPTRDGWIEF